MGNGYIVQERFGWRCRLKPKQHISEVAEFETEKIYFVLEPTSEKERGPFSLKELNEGRQRRDFHSEARYAVEGMSEWLPLEFIVNRYLSFKQWKEGQDEDLMDSFPAHELYRAQDEPNEPSWGELWMAAAEAVGDRGAIASFQKGRMVARKDSKIWVQLSDFDTPYPPFKVGSGMDIQDVDREDAVALGVLKMNEKVAVQRIEFTPF